MSAHQSDRQRKPVITFRILLVCGFSADSTWTEYLAIRAI